MPSSTDEPTTEERIESEAQISAKAARLATLIRTSKHLLVFTGFGISTSAGVPDFRGPQGKWTLAARGERLNASAECTLQAVPTPTHMALVRLLEVGRVKYVVSQNCDGLHRRSGVAGDQISELHGNSNREVCVRCGREYLRDFRAVASHEKTVLNHRTGRRCTTCRGDLYDTLVHFTESLPPGPMELAREHARNADLCLVLGSSLTVIPASAVPELVGQRRGAKLVICNLQETPMDGLASTRIWAKADDLMERVMQLLDLGIPAFVLRRRLRLQLQPVGKSSCRLVVAGLDGDNTPASFLQNVRVERRVAKQEPFVFDLRSAVGSSMKVKVVVQFMGHYGEPDLELDHHCGSEEGLECVYMLSFDPRMGEWTTEREGGESL